MITAYSNVTSPQDADELVHYVLETRSTIAATKEALEEHALTWWTDYFKEHVYGELDDNDVAARAMIGASWVILRLRGWV